MLDTGTVHGRELSLTYLAQRADMNYSSTSMHMDIAKENLWRPMYQYTSVIVNSGMCNRKIVDSLFYKDLFPVTLNLIPYPNYSYKYK